MLTKIRKEIDLNKSNVDITHSTVTDSNNCNIRLGYGSLLATVRIYD